MICALTPVSNICFDVSVFRKELASANGESESSPETRVMKVSWRRREASEPLGGRASA
jgi:hypothetical protein